MSFCKKMKQKDLDKLLKKYYKTDPEWIKKIDFKKEYQTIKDKITCAKIEALEIGRKIKKDPKTFFKNLFKIGIIYLFLRYGATGCSKEMPFEPYKQKDGNSTVQNTSAYIFNGDTETENIKVSDEEGVYKAIAKAIRPDGSIANTYTIKSEGKAVPSAEKDVNITYDTNGTWKIATETTDNLGNISRETQNREVYLNEAQSDDNLVSVAQSMISTASNDGDIIDVYGPNQTLLGYTNDVVLKIKMTGGSGFGFYCIDVQGSKMDLFDQTKKDTLNANDVGHKYLKPEQDIEEEIDILKNSGWPDMGLW